MGTGRRARAATPLALLRSGFAGAARREPVPADARIDRSRPFLCPTATPLHYTSARTDLSPAQALRANQLTGLYFNELIAFFETMLAPTVLAALGRSKLGAELAECLEHFLADEARHAAMFERLNRLSEPTWYERRRFHILSISRTARAGLALLARWPAAFPAILWLTLALEEHSLEVSLRCDASGGIEPHWAAAWHAHLEDEVRHVEVDRHLVERFQPAQPRLLRRINAAVVSLALGRFLLTPRESSFRVVAQLVAEFPELRPRQAALVTELRALGRNPEYVAMMYSREATPITFALLDRFPEFHCLERVLGTYRAEAVR